MAITRSSRAITSIDLLPAARRRRRRWQIASVVGVAGVSAALIGSSLSGHAAAPVPAPQAAVQPPAPVKVTPPPPQVGGGPSFFDDFNKLDTARWYISDGWTNGAHQGCYWSRNNVAVSNGTLQLILSKSKDAKRQYDCAELKTLTRLGYGTYEARMRTAAGSGLNSAIFTFSGSGVGPVHDEIDFEFLGRNPGGVQLNYFTSGKGGHETVPPLGSDGSAGFNDYAFVWAPGSIRWYMNGKLMREASGDGLPVTPGAFFLTLWNGAAPSAAWLGDFDASRTPTLAEVEWAGFTRAGERCRFPQSITCKLP